jgi:sugar lactone lactonase YvrE
LAGLVTAVAMLTAPAALGVASRYAPVAGSPYAMPDFADSAVFSPDGRLLAVDSTDLVDHGTRLRSDSQLFAVSGTGALTALPGSLVSTTGDPLGFITFSPDGKLISAYGALGLSLYAVGHDGIAGEVGTWRYPLAGVAHVGADFGPHGRLLAVPLSTKSGHRGAGTELYMLAVGRNGRIRRVPGTPVLVGSPASNVAATDFSPSGRLIALADEGEDMVWVYAVRPNGSVSRRAVSVAATADVPTSVAFSPGGRLLAVANDFSDDVSIFRVGRGGALRAAQGSPFTTGADSGPDALAFSPDGRLLVVADSGGLREPVFAVSPGGALRRVQLLRASDTAGPDVVSADGVSFSPDGRLLAISDYAGATVWMFSRP